MPNPRVAIVFHSGAGGTELAARLVAELVGRNLDVSVNAVSDRAALEATGEADLLVLFFPTYFLRPSTSTLDFIDSLENVSTPRPVFLVTTYELYTENCLRAAARALGKRGYVAVGSGALRAPGSDVTCVLPDRLIPWLYRFEPKFAAKLDSIAARIVAAARGGRIRYPLPWPKWYTPFAQALQFLALDKFAVYKDKFVVLGERCTGCGACAALCRRGAWRIDAGRPVHDPSRCELCTRCIHRCPSRSIVLVDRLKDNARLDRALYQKLETEARERLAAHLADRFVDRQ